MNRWKHKVLLLILTIAISVCSSSVCAAVHQDTKTPDVIFSSNHKEDFYFTLLNTKTGEGEQLETQVTYTDKAVVMTGLEPISLKGLQNGTAALEICYPLKPNTRRTSQPTQNLGEVSITLSEDEPYWRVCNENGSWGVGIRNIGIPQIVYDLLPTEIAGMELTNENNKMILKNPILKTAETKIETIQLNQCKLPEYIVNQIIANNVTKSNLEIMANYDFKIQIPYREFHDSNCEVEHLIWMEGKITIRYAIVVNHDSNKSEKVY